MASDFSLVKDIEQLAQSSNPKWILPVGSDTFFVADTPEYGTELWKTDGTPAGTHLVKDIAPSLVFPSITITQDSNPSDLFEHDGKLFFTADDKVHGRELWMSDGTEAGTVMVRDIRPGASAAFGENTSFPYVSNFASIGTELFFGASDGSAGFELWKTDGTSIGTGIVADINPGSGGAAPLSLVTTSDTLFFHASDPTNGRELWKSDGTAAGTEIVADIAPGSTNGIVSFTKIGAIDEKVYFHGDDGITGMEPWVSDGTSLGTILLADIASGAVDSRPQNFTQAGSNIFFTLGASSSQLSSVGGNELWMTDGTPAGTQLVKDIVPGNNGSSPSNLFSHLDKLYFSASAGWWTTDGTEPGTLEIQPDGDRIFASEVVSIESSIYFRGSTASQPETAIWKSNGTNSGTVRIAETGRFAQSFVVSGQEILFVNRELDTGFELWRSDGSQSGTSLLTDLTPGTASSDPSGLTSIGDSIVFSANDDDGFTGRELWISSGTETSTQLLREFEEGLDDGNPSRFQVIGNKTIFSADENGERMFVLDNSSKQISPLAPFPLIFQGDFDLNGVLIGPTRTNLGWELGRTDGTPAGTFVIRDINPGFVHSNPGGFSQLGDDALFFATVLNEGVGLWKTDGTDAGTSLIKDIAPGNAGTISGGIEVNGKVIFGADDGGAAGDELWSSDGTSAGTNLLKDLWPGTTNDSKPRSFVKMQADAYFFAFNDSGLGLFRSDATSSGTVLLKSFGATAIAPSIAASELVVVDDRLFFKMDDGVHGEELWVSDGTALGTQLVKDIYAGAASPEIGPLTQIDGVLFFAADDGVSGRELWQSDGTTGGTQLAADVYAGSPSSDPSDLVNHNGVLYFSAATEDFGRELIRLNAVPTVDSALYSIAKDTSLNTTLTGADADGESLTWAVTVEPEHGQLTGVAPNLIYTPDPGFSGSDEFYFSASDGVATSPGGRIAINVRGENPIITFDQASATYAESTGRIEVPFSSDTAPPYDVVTTIDIGGTAFSTKDYVRAGQLVLPANMTSGVLSIDLVDDSTYEPGSPEQIVIEILPNSDYDLGTTTETTIQIVDDDPIPTVSFVRRSTNVDETIGTALVDVILSAESTQSVTVPLMISGTATAGVDFQTPVSGDVTIVPGQRVRSIVLPIIEDSESEGLESIVIDLGAPTNAVLGTDIDSPRRGTVYIRPSDTPILNFDVVSQTVSEADGTVQFTATLSSPLATAITVPIVVGGTAIEGSDFNLSGQQFEFSAGQTEATITATIADDTLIETTEFGVFSFDVIANSDFELGQHQNAFVYIQDNDAVLSISVSEARVWEDHSTPIQLHLELSNSVPVDTIVDITIEDLSRSMDGRFTFDGNTASSRSVTIPANQTSISLPINLIDNDLDQANGALRINAIKRLDNQRQSRSVVLSVMDNDPTLSLEQVYVPGTGTRAGTTQADASTGFSLGPNQGFGSRQRGSQYNSQRYRQYYPPARTVVTTKLVTVSESAPSVNLAFRLSKPTNREVHFDLNAIGTATIEGGGAQWPDINDEFGDLNSRFTIPVGMGVTSPRTVVLNLNSDSTFEPTETLTITAKNAENANIVELDRYTGNRIADQGGILQAKINIKDDDQKPQVSITSSRSQLIEFGYGRIVNGSIVPDADWLNVDVSIDRRLDVDSEVFLFTNGGVAKEGRDFKIIGLDEGGRVLIPSGSTSASFRVEVLDDKFYEGDEAISLRVALTKRATLGGQTLLIQGLNSDRLSINQDSDRVELNLIDSETAMPVEPPKPVAETIEVANAVLFNQVGDISDVLSGSLQVQPVNSGSYSEIDSATQQVLADALITANASFNGDAAYDIIPIGSLQIAMAQTGLLENATVFLDSNFNGIQDFIDTNGNGEQDADELAELSAMTQLDGSFSLTFDQFYDLDNDGLFSPADGRLVLTGGTDVTIDSDRPVGLSAPIGTFAVTPLTTLAESLVRRHSLSVSEALVLVNRALGLGNYNTRFGNALYEIVNGEELAGTAYKRSLQIHNTALQIAAAIDGASTASDQSSVASATYDVIADLMAGQDSQLDLTQPAVLGTILDSVSSRFGVVLSTNIHDGLVQVAAESSMRIDAVAESSFSSPVDFADMLLRIKRVVREDATDRIFDAAAGNASMADVVSDFTGTGFETRLAAVTAEVVVPPSILITHSEVVEGNDGQTELSFEVILSGDHDRTVSVDYSTADGTATADSGDYTAVAGTLQWLAGDNTSRTITVPVTGDTLAESDERISILLSEPVNGVIRHGQAQGFIVNDDTFSPPLTVPSSGQTRLINVKADGVASSAYSGNSELYSGVFTQPLSSSFVGNDEFEDHFSVAIDGEAIREDQYQIHGGDGVWNDRLEWIGDDLTDVTIHVESMNAGTVVLESEFESRSMQLSWTGIEMLASHSFGVRHFKVLIDASLAPSLILEDADFTEFGRLRLRSLDGLIPSIEFSNPTESVQIVGQNSSAAFVQQSIDERFTGTVDFSTPNQDFGDAPAPFPTLLSDDGARHTATGPRLGATRDAELDGQRSEIADGDASDEDGVMFGIINTVNSMAGVNIELQNAMEARVDVWLDFDRDGTWSASEKVLNNQTVIAGLQTLNFDLPDGITPGQNFARVRLSSNGQSLPTGAADDGEVEDYLVNIVSVAPPTVESISINAGDSQRSLVTEIAVTFDSEVVVNDTAIALINRETNLPVENLNIVSSITDGRTTSLITFGVGQSVDTMAGGLHSLSDGNYQLDINGIHVNSLAGGTAMQGTHSFGDEASDNFFRHFGDTDGDRDVDGQDYGRFGLSFLKSSVDAAFNENVDSDGDGDVDGQDYGRFGARFLKSLEF